MPNLETETRRYPEDIRLATVDTDGAQVFACASVPIGARPQRFAVICPSLLHEYERAHRGVRLCAAQLAARGIPVVRFDYTGTGESSDLEPPLAELMSERWTRDAVAVARHFASTLKIEEVVFVGFRFGGFIAAQAAKQMAMPLGIWHPQISGASLLAHWEADHTAMNSALGRDASVYGEALMGWDLPQDVRTDIASLSIDPQAADWCLGNASEVAPFEHAGADSVTVPDGEFWNAGGGEAMVPATAISEMGDFLLRSAS